METMFNCNKMVTFLCCGFIEYDIVLDENVFMETEPKDMFTLYRIDSCSVSKVALVQCEQELMFCCGAEIVPKLSQYEQKPYPVCNLQRSPFDLKRSFTKTRFRCNFCSDKSVQTLF